MKKLYEFFWDCGRMGDVEGLFIADDAEVERLIGRDVYFGEILGKHSEVTGTLDKEDLKVLTDDQEFLTKLTELTGFDSTISGYNPIETILEWDYEMGEDDED